MSTHFGFLVDIPVSIVGKYEPREEHTDDAGQLVLLRNEIAQVGEEHHEHGLLSCIVIHVHISQNPGTNKTDEYSHGDAHDAQCEEVPHHCDDILSLEEVVIFHVFPILGMNMVIFLF